MSFRACFQLRGTAGPLRPWFCHASPYFSGERLLHNGSSSEDNSLLTFYKYRSMHRSGSASNPSVYSSIFKVCASSGLIEQGGCVHGIVIKNGFDSETSVANSIMGFYNSCGMTASARNLFRFMLSRDCVSWTVVMAGYIEDGTADEALHIFTQARSAGLEPNISTLVLVLRACCILEARQEGKQVHGLSIRNGYSSVLSIENSLLNFYAKCGDIRDAVNLFDQMLERDVITWSTIITGCVENGQAHFGLQMFKEMWVSDDINPDGLTMVGAIRVCSSLGDVSELKKMHSCVVKLGFESDVFMGNSLIDAYSKCDGIDEARLVFFNMKFRNKVSWNSIISGSVYTASYVEALMLFRLMRQEGTEADEVTMVNLLQSSKYIGDGNQCKSVHTVIIRRGLETPHVLNSIMDAYMKCELLEIAKRVFNGMTNRNLVSWSTLIAGFNHCSKPHEAIHTFREMILSGEKPNFITMLSVLEACTLLASLQQGKWAHGFVIRNGFEKEVAVGTAILNMYAKCGDVVLAKKVFDLTPEKNIVTWSAMISAYGFNSRGEDAVTLFRGMQLKPNNVTLLSLLSACSHGGLVDEGRLLFKEFAHDPEMSLSLQHYACMVDLLGRAGLLDHLGELIKEMLSAGIEAGASVWGAVLSACRSHGNTNLGREAFEYVSQLEPAKAACYTLASNMYADAGVWSEAARMRSLVRERRLKVVAGYSLIQVKNGVHKFVSGDRSHPQSCEVYATIEHLLGAMKLVAIDHNFLS
ncbi:pentatricopeptide repeat-containing protein At2g17210-like [Nymphaea colorata]|nr:pentatricopeptide repeat-containing protein At2g17210-like [Nymphaea colorata]